MKPTDSQAAGPESAIMAGVLSCKNASVSSGQMALAALTGAMQAGKERGGGGAGELLGEPPSERLVT